MTQKDLELVQRERDLYWRLLELGTNDDLSLVLSEALSLIVEVTQAKKGFLSIYDEEQEEPRWWIASGCSPEEVNNIRQRVSSGIIAEAMATSQTIVTTSAFEDPRFEANESVKSHKIKAVLCAPLGKFSSMGALYLQERNKPGPFSEDDRRRAEAFARHLVPFVDRLRQKAIESESKDHTKAYRQRLQLSSIIGCSKALAATFSQIESAARFDLPVLLTGASGTGKTALARAIHQNSTRAAMPFVEINCAAIPEHLFESEFFGAVPGAHSTATKKIMGKIAAAERGTLFLDEIGELSLPLQSKLLQFLQSKEYFPLGAPKSERANVRLIAATNIDFSVAIEEKLFREDLFYRLNVLTVHLSPLSSRKDDILPLAKSFCQQTCAQHDLPHIELSPGALAVINTADWPGNVRQLMHAVQSATIRASTEGFSAVEAHHVFPQNAHKSSSPNQTLSFHEAVRQFQKQTVSKALEATDWNISEASRRLDIARSYLNTLIHSFNLRRTPKKNSSQ
jgi:Nif-specific regulatory protein